MNPKPNETTESHVTRREFLRTTSAALAGASVLGALSVERSAFAAEDNTLKIALIGCGGRGTAAAGQALSTDGPVKLVAMADAFEDRLSGSLKGLADRHGDKVDVPADRQFIGFDAYKQAIALADVVILATPPGFRPMQFEEAVNQGKHVFMEKPVATDAPGVRRVLAAAEAAKPKNLKIVVGLQRRYQAGYLETVKRIQDGAIGDIVAARAYWDGQTPWLHRRADLEKQAGRKLTEMEYQMRNWYYFTWICGDHILEQHIHNIDVINWVKGGYPVRAQGQGGCQVRKGLDYGEIFDHHFVEFEYADGSRLFSQCRHIPDCWNSVSEHVTGTKGTATISSHVIRPAGGAEWAYRERQKDPQQVEHDVLFDCIRNNKPINNAEYGAKSTMTAILGRMATYSGQMIEWDAAINSKVNLFPDRLAWDALPKSLPDANGLYKIPLPGQTEVL
ncbi:MAG TPA: Gfo/Idh/MocA family oxidoreductase [Verrucomicrobiae bacterium]|nr:Gfo/Idh/MocA family oxidoreductase [Verrucomicrobiae bacterium]